MRQQRARIVRDSTPGHTYRFTGLIAKPDGSLKFETSKSGKPEDAVSIGTAAGEELKEKIGSDSAAFFGDFEARARCHATPAVPLSIASFARHLAPLHLPSIAARSPC